MRCSRALFTRLVCVIILCGIATCGTGIQALSAQDLRVRIAPLLALPVADTDVFGSGVGVVLALDYELAGFVAPYVGLDVRAVAPAARELDASLFLASGGVGVRVFAFPFARLKVGAAAGGGAYLGSYQRAGTSVMTGNLYWQADAQAGYRFRPGFVLSGELSYGDYRSEAESFHRAIAVSLVAEIGIGIRSGDGRVALESVESSPVYPIVAPRYASNPVGTLELRNAESAEIRNVKVWFEVDGYTSGPALCAEISYLRRNGTALVPILARFSDQVMRVSETVRISGRVTVEYEFLGEPRTARNEATITIMHRNALTWEDPRALAAFVSPNDPAVLDTTKYTAGLIRSAILPGLDSNLQYALGVFEGLRLSGIVWSPDPQTPYAETRSSATVVDYVQYPHQTIGFRGGDSDDLAVLYAAALESVGIPAALLPLDSEVLVAFRMRDDETATRSGFLESDDFLFVHGEAWVPVRVSLLRDGFLRAWSEGAALARAVSLSETFSRLSDAWQDYPPVAVPGITIPARRPPEGPLLAAFSSALTLIVDREVNPRAERLRASFGPGGGTPRQRNHLGVMFARYARYPEALEEFAAAEALGHSGAKINIGNVAFLMRDFVSAIDWYQRAAATLPDNTAALLGLARAYYELDRYDEADRFFRLATDVEPDLAERFPYLSARLDGSELRASAMADRDGDVLWEQ